MGNNNEVFDGSDLFVDAEDTYEAEEQAGPPIRIHRLTRRTPTKRKARNPITRTRKPRMKTKNRDTHLS